MRSPTGNFQFWPLALLVAVVFGGTANSAMVKAEPAGQSPSAGASRIVEYSVDVDGRTRTFGLYTPAAIAAGSPAALVILLHGGGSRGRSMERLAHFSQVADRHDFVVAYPDGVEKHWNDGRNLAQYASHREKVDDVAFVRVLVGKIAELKAIDRSRVYVAGMSNGGLMAHRIACEAPDLIAAMAPVEGLIAENVANTCGAPLPVPTLLIKGAAAPVFERSSKRLTARATTEFWAARNGCALTPQVSELPDVDPTDRTKTRRIAFTTSCRDGADVVLLEVEGGGHTWPGGWSYLPEETIGRTSRDFDASEEIWRFFSAHHR